MSCAARRATPVCIVFPFSACSFFVFVWGTARGFLPLTRCAAAVWVACFVMVAQRRRSRAVVGLGAVLYCTARTVAVSWWLSAPGGSTPTAPTPPRHKKVPPREAAAKRHAGPHSAPYSTHPSTAGHPSPAVDLVCSHGSSAVPPSGARRRPRVWSPIIAQRRRRCDPTLRSVRPPEPTGGADRDAPQAVVVVRSCTLWPPPGTRPTLDGDRNVARPTDRPAHWLGRGDVAPPRARGGVCPGGR